MNSVTLHKHSEARFRTFLGFAVHSMFFAYSAYLEKQIKADSIAEKYLIQLCKTEQWWGRVEQHVDVHLETGKYENLNPAKHLQ